MEQENNRHILMFNKNLNLHLLTEYETVPEQTIPLKRHTMAWPDEDQEKYQHPDLLVFICVCFAFVWFLACVN